MKLTVILAATLGLSAALASTAVLAEEASHYVEPNISHADFGELNIVMPVTANDEGVWKERINHAMNAVSTASRWNGHAHVTIVVYGAAIQLFTHHGDAVAAMVEKARSNGVVFKACNNSLKGFNIDWRTLNNVAEADIVPAGILEVPYLEQKGYFLDSE